ncbi:hypothetical protein [Bradyrhizobium paxllaeri]|uniref:hypothetical protein n=1 Tax=Bradyrhizobium paxllaeri TaxID=190148 RepID=UPI001146363C|nr:hypothetical protein [Bradyrhizobium paxllaeri]
MALAARKQSSLLVPTRRVLIPQRRVLRPRLAIPGIAPLPVGARKPVPGSTNYGSAGSYTFVFPYCDTFSIDMYAPGGGGGGAVAYWNGVVPGSPGGAGGYMQFYRDGICNLVAYGGNGGPAGAFDAASQSPGRQTAHGTASGGQGNVTGGGRAGGVEGRTWQGSTTFYGWIGGNGARVYSTFTNCRTWEGWTFSLTVGSPGSAGANGTSTGYTTTQYPATGGSGTAYVSWS